MGTIVLLMLMDGESLGLIAAAPRVQFGGSNPMPSSVSSNQALISLHAKRIQAHLILWVTKEQRARE